MEDVFPFEDVSSIILQWVYTHVFMGGCACYVDIIISVYWYIQSLIEYRWCVRVLLLISGNSRNLELNCHVVYSNLN